MVRHAKTNGWYEIECPFAHEHTDGRDDSTYLPRGLSHTGASRVECQHDHGQATAKPSTHNASGPGWWPRADRRGPTRIASSTVLHEVLKKIAADARGAPPPRKQTDRPPDLFNMGTLAQAIGRHTRSRAWRSPIGQKTAIQDPAGDLCQCRGRPAGPGRAAQAEPDDGQDGLHPARAIDMARFGTKTEHEITDWWRARWRTCFATRHEEQEGSARLLRAHRQCQYWHPMQ